jgi:hypothetical protein
MFTTDLTLYHTQVKELHRQAAQYRLVRKVQKPDLQAHKLTVSAGQRLIQSGEQLISRSNNKG